VLTITGLAQGPDAVGRHDGRVIFVPGAAPGDRVRVRVAEQHGNYARAVLVHRCEAGPSYREPPCPWIGECGGCPWQHVDYPTQLAAKAANVRETLKRIAGVTAGAELAIVAAPAEWEYRHRIRLHVGPGRTLGYRRARSHAVVAIEHCRIADPLLSSSLGAVRALTARLATRVDDVEMAANGRGGIALHAIAHGGFHEHDADAIERWLAETPAAAGVQLRGHGWVRRYGDLRLHVAAPEIDTRAGSFTQVNPAANRLLIASVTALVEPGTRVLDLFCGAGNLSLPLARQAASVVGVDHDREAIADAARSAVASGLTTVRFEAAHAERFLRRHGLAGADTVVLDPPRGGAPAVATQLARLLPARILYVSCDPATLARDVRTLAAVGYAAARVQALDLFPQTAHVETVLEAVLTAG